MGSRLHRHHQQNGNGSPKKKSSSTSSIATATTSSTKRPGVTVPDWFDLPLLLPDTDPMLGRIQRKYLETIGNDTDTTKHPGATTTVATAAAASAYAIPKVSRLSPQTEITSTTAPATAMTQRRRKDLSGEKERELMIPQRTSQPHSKWTKETNKLVMRMPRRRVTTQSGAPVVLDRLTLQQNHQRARLRDKIWKDLQLDRYGLWPIGRHPGGGEDQEEEEEEEGEEDAEETMASVEATVDSILNQWQRQASGGAKPNQAPDEEPLLDQSSNSGVFLTAVPVAHTGHARRGSVPIEELRSSTEQATLSSGAPEDQGDDRNDDIADDADADDDIQDDDHDEEEDTTDTSVHRRGFRREIHAPGLKRRQRLQELHVFVEKQLQKRLLRSWETIEIALAGSGDLSVNQIVKFLQNSDVKLSAVDAAKVQSVLNSHLGAKRKAQAEAEADAARAASTAISETVGKPESVKASAATAKVSYEAFRKIFQPKDTQESTRWKREFERENVRVKQEKEVYERELAVLEAKVKKRLDESARHMVDVLDTFQCDPRGIPWDSDPQRLALRDQFLRVLFSKPAKRRLSLVSASIQAAASATPLVSTGGAPLNHESSNSEIPLKLSVPQLRSALLQKYSRNGHFDAIEVPAAAYLFHDLAADRIQASVRAVWKRRAADLWPERQQIFAFRLQKAVFLAWKRFTKHADVLRKFVLRKFVAWAFWTRKWHRYYAFYKACFWPFYVWKRELQRMILARGKSVFLKNVLVTVILVRHFRAWKTRFRRKGWVHKQIHRLRNKKRRQLLRICWSEWLTRLRVGIQIHRLWKSHGHVLQRLHKGYMVKVTFVLWRYYSILKQDMAARQHKCFHSQFPAIGASKNRWIASKGAAGPRATAAATTRASVSTTRPVDPHGHGHQPPRGVSWYAPQQHSNAPGLAGTRSVSAIDTSSTTATPGEVSSAGDVDGIAVDAFVGEAGDHHDAEEEHEEREEREDVVAIAETAEPDDVRTLSKIMETDLAPKIKRKTKLYDMCLHLYLRFRERDRCAMTANIVVFRRIGRQFFTRMAKYVAWRKKNRMATDLGAFRILYRRFRWWLAVSVYKHPLVKHGSSAGVRGELGEDNRDVGSENGDRGLEEEDDDDDGSVANPRGHGLTTKSVALDWKGDTAWRQHGLVHLPQEADTLRLELLAIAAETARRMERMQDLELQLRDKKRHEDVFLRKEAGATLKVRALQMQQAQQILRTRGHRMHDVLDRVFDDLRAQQRRQQLKSSFRGLRVVMMDRYTATLCHRAQLRNWLRLCKKFQFWEHNSAKFHALRVKFHVFRTLLRHVVWKWKHESAGLSAHLQQRQKLLFKYEHYLDRHGLLTGSATASRIALTKYSPANSFHGVFLRWTQYTQLSRTYRQIGSLCQRKRELWQMHSIFQTLTSSLKIKYTLASRRARVPFLWRQCEADLDALHCKIVAVRARLPSQRLRKQLLRTQHDLQRTATGAPTLKQLFQQHEQAIRHRLFLESRLMFVAYNERRVHHFGERQSPLFGAPVGRSFGYEMAPPYASISEIVVLSGKKVDALSLVLKTQASVTVDGQLHGNPFGNREVFTLSKGEKLVVIEGFASQTIYALRFGTSTGRLSKWFGQIEKGTKFELRSDWGATGSGTGGGGPGKREEIVGVYGYADATSIHALGCVFRHTTLRNIFEGMWLAAPGKTTPSGGGGSSSSSSSTLTAIGDHASSANGGGGGSDGGLAGAGAAHSTSSSDPSAAPQHQHPRDDVALCDRQFAYFLQVRVCDVLLAMKRAHAFALRLHRLGPQQLPYPLSKTRVMMSIMRWYFNSLTHGLVHSSTREDEGKRILQDGMNKRASGERLVEDGTRLLAEVDTFRDESRQLNVATLGVRKVTELKAMTEQGDHKIALGKQCMDDGQREMLRGRHILPHIPMTKRMMNAIRRMYKVVQTKDYIDQMDPELRAILLEGDGAAMAGTGSIYDQL